MSKSAPTNSNSCCENHDEPHVEGCRRDRPDGLRHLGACITDPSAAANQRAADEARIAATQQQPRVAWIQVALDDDSEVVPYLRPSVLEILDAHDGLKRLDAAGQLPADTAAQVRVLLGTVGRLSAGGLAEAFPRPPALRLVEGQARS